LHLLRNCGPVSAKLSDKVLKTRYLSTLPCLMDFHFELRHFVLEVPGEQHVQFLGDSFEAWSTTFHYFTWDGQVGEHERTLPIIHLTPFRRHSFGRFNLTLTRGANFHHTPPAIPNFQNLILALRTYFAVCTLFPGVDSYIFNNLDTMT
uniref:HECT domain-containing protein n=1 Tax=Haemonchus placei TaxID=6290 RepID=A0A0N4WM91_HAEPC